MDMANSLTLLIQNKDVETVVMIVAETVRDVVVAAADVDAVVAAMTEIAEMEAKTKVRAATELADSRMVARDVEDAKVQAEAVEATEEPLNQVLMALLMEEPREVEVAKATRARPVRKPTHTTESQELAVEREMIADKVLVLAGAMTRNRTLMQMKVLKRPRSREKTTAKDALVLLKKRKRSRRSNPKKRLDSPLMTTKLRRRILDC